MLIRGSIYSTTKYLHNIAKLKAKTPVQSWCTMRFGVASVASLEGHTRLHQRMRKPVLFTTLLESIPTFSKLSVDFLFSKVP
jgi:hypothetical protein